MNAPYVPLLVNFSHEDKAAKGLRSLRDPAAASTPARYFTAAEIITAGGPVLLLGERGSGKTTFALRLTEDPRFHYQHADGLTSVDGLAKALRPGQIPVIDGIDRLADAGPRLLAEALARFPNQIVVLGETAVVRSWPLPVGYQVHTLLPLGIEQRSAALGGGQAGAGALSPPAANPALFALAVDLPGSFTTAEELLDAWLSDRPAGDLAAGAFAALRDGASFNRAVDGLLAARHLQTLPLPAVAARFATAPQLWAPSLASLARRLERPEPLVEQLLGLPGDLGMRGALLSTDVLADDSPLLPAVRAHLLAIVAAGRLSPAERDRAAQALAKGGDPRDLEALVEVPGGTFTFGSNTHPNSAPSNLVTVAAFRIGQYPVTNAQYARFVAASQRLWRSPDGLSAERANAPATDLTWHDARAYCDWLTQRWRAAGRISPTEVVRLPTEPEWERAARGDQPDAGDAIVYPWIGPWDPDAANADQTGFNRTCAVGLFPNGRSPYGCHDMVGQAWEWTSTLWGRDMTSPSFAYPYRDDGREATDAPGDIRRVLRGGCFSSTSLKACCTYRGSLEPDGYWRGNSFRIVVAEQA